MSSRGNRGIEESCGGLHGTRCEISGAFNRGYGLREKLVRGTLMLEYKDVVGNVGQANRFSYNG